MKNVTVLWLFIAFCLTPGLYGQLGLDVMLDLNTDKIVDGLTPLLQANCSVFEDSNSTATNSTLTQPFALRIKINTTEIATVSSLNAPDPVITSEGTGLGAVVKGHLEVDGSDSYITVSFKYPNTSHAGNISCEMSGMDDGFHIVKVDDATMVTFSGVGLEDAVGEIKAHDSRLAKLEAGMSSLLDRLDSFKDAMTSFEFTINSSSYLVSRPIMQNAALAESSCKLVGGYLLEVNDAYELQQVKEYLTNESVALDVLVGVSDEGDVGQWKFTEHSDLAVFESPTNIAGADKGSNCALMMHDDSWLPRAQPCYRNDVNMLFICEMSQP